MTTRHADIFELGARVESLEAQLVAVEEERGRERAAWGAERARLEGALAKANASAAASDRVVAMVSKARGVIG